jgi:hypothetical protein
MRISRRNSFFFVVLASVFLVLSSHKVSANGIDDTMKGLNRGCNTVISTDFYRFTPKKVAILPFSDHTKKPGDKKGYLTLDPETARKVFYEHFSPLGYHDVELNDIDGILKANGIALDDSLRKIPARDLGRILQADTLIYGDITHFDVAYAFLYSQISIGFSMMMVSAETGEILWRIDDMKRSHKFKVGLDPLSIVSGIAQTAIYLNQKNVLKVLDELSREIVATVPPAQQEEKKISSTAWIDTAEKKCRLQGDEIRVHFKGKTGLQVSADIESLIKALPLKEEGLGNYQGMYTIAKGDHVINPGVVVTYQEKNGKKESIEIKTDMVVDAVPPPPPQGNITLEEFSGGFRLCWKYPDVEDFDYFKIYKRKKGAKPQILFGTKHPSCLIKEDINGVTSYIITAVDKCGNESEGIEVIPRKKKP